MNNSLEKTDPFNSNNLKNRDGEADSILCHVVGYNDRDQEPVQKTDSFPPL